MAKKAIFVVVVALNIFLLTGFLTTVSADIKEMTDEEFKDFQAGCMKEEKCAKAFESLMKKVQSYERELKAVCQSSHAECVKKQRESYTAIIAGQLGCALDLEVEECNKVMNEKAGRLEKGLLEGAWCDKNREACKAIKSERESRRKRKEGWCDVNKSACQKVVARYIENSRLLENQRKKVREEAAKKYAIHQQQKEEEWFMSRATCEGKVEECIAQINEKMEFFEKRRLERSCKKGKVEVCNRIKEERAKRAEKKLAWCDTHKQVCEDARKKRLAAKEVTK